MDEAETRKALDAIPSIPREDGDAVFAEPWEARAFAMAVALNEQGLFEWPQWADIFSVNLKTNEASDAPRSYYQVWMMTLEEIVEAKGIADTQTRVARQQAWEAAAARTPHGKAIEL